MMVSIIAAIGKRRALGNDNGLLWHIPDDLKRFKALTLGHPVIMGRKTWESLPARARPLPGRTNIVITRQSGYEAPGAEVTDSLDSALEIARNAEGKEEIFIMGGGEIYAQALPHTDRLYVTLIDDEKEANVYFPEYKSTFTKEISREDRNGDGLQYHWLTLEK